MANANAPVGLTPLRYLSGAPYNGAANRYFIPSTDGTAAYVGALVKPAGSADADGNMTVTSNVSTGNPVLGPIVAVEPVDQSSTIYRVASTARYVYVADDPNLVFEVQDDGVSATAATDIGNTADLTGFTSGSTVTGRSSTQVSAASKTASGDGTEDVLIIGLTERSTNALGVNAKLLVRLNNHFFVDGVAGA